MYRGKRYALATGRIDSVLVAAYLPSNYSVAGETSLGVVIEGNDKFGWTLDGYVLPRLASALIVVSEIDLSHPAMKEI